MRDLDRLKEKTVLALDSRQLFFVFFGGSVAAALLFALGILVGRKLPSQERDIEEDPLAMLDQLGAEEEALSFPKGLKGRAQPAAAPPASSAPPAVAQEPAVAPTRLSSPATAGPAAVDSRPMPAALPEAPTKAVAAKPIVKTSDPPSAAPSPTPTRPRLAREKDARPPAPESVSNAEADAAASRFTLQLQSFQEKGEAAEFMSALGKKGYETYLMSAEVPGRGLWYRVRLGEYTTHSDALAAKAEFERKQRIIAYVMRK